MKLTDIEIIEAMLFMKEQHNSEMPYKFGRLECASLMHKYAESKFNNVVLADVSKSVCPLCDGSGRRVFPNCTPPIDNCCPACNRQNDY